MLSRTAYTTPSAAPADALVLDTFKGLLAFIVPGPDAYSLAQGMGSTTPGGVDIGVAAELVATIDRTAPFVPAFAATVAGALNSLALAVNPEATAPFASAFANLSFAHKAAVFQIMDATAALKLLGGVLPPFVAFFCYSEAAAFDPGTRSLTGHPVAWGLSGYRGVADGRDELRGYYGRRHDPGR